MKMEHTIAAPANAVDAVKELVAAMAKIGFDISHARPKLLDPALVERADRIITMGCDVEGVPRIDDDWGLPDPKGQPPERVFEIRDLVCKKAGELAKELLRPVLLNQGPLKWNPD